MTARPSGEGMYGQTYGKNFVLTIHWEMLTIEYNFLKKC